MAALLAAMLMPIVAASVIAECDNLAIDPIKKVNVGAAFLATVTDVSNAVDPNPNGSAFNIHVKLSVQAVYYGHVPKVLVFNDWAGLGCGELRTESLHVGDQIIVAAEGLTLAHLPAPPFDGHLVAWQKAGNHWAFFVNALAFGSDPQFYPGAAREARTKAEVLAVIAAWAMPDTSTSGDVPLPASNSGTLLPVVAFVFGLAVAMRRLGRKPSRDIPRR